MVVLKLMRARPVKHHDPNDDPVLAVSSALSACPRHSAFAEVSAPGIMGAGSRVDSVPES
jgi:hypothetical protein